MSLIEDVDRLLKEIGPLDPVRTDGGGRGLPRNSWATTSRAETFPYDGDDDHYGEPGIIDRGSNAGEPLRHFIVPRDVQDDDERFEEAMGSPSNVAMAYRSDRGNDIPGAIGGWSHPPAKPWDEDEELEEASGYDPQPPPNDDAEGLGAHGVPGNDELAGAARAAGLFSPDDLDAVDVFPDHDPPSDISVVGTAAPFMSGLGRSWAPGRGRGGLIPKESTWRWIEELLRVVF